MKYSRQIKYYALRFARLRGQPHELALGIALGVFAGMMPIMPFQIALALTLAIFFKGSKITAALGTWISNPLNWYFLYAYSYRIGAGLLGLSEGSKPFSAIMSSVRDREDLTVLMGKMAGAGGFMVSAFLIGGILMGVVAAVPSYFLFLKVFQTLARWRQERRRRKQEKRRKV